MGMLSCSQRHRERQGKRAGIRLPSLLVTKHQLVSARIANHAPHDLLSAEDIKFLTHACFVVERMISPRSIPGEDGAAIAESTRSTMPSWWRVLRTSSSWAEGLPFSSATTQTRLTPVLSARSCWVRPSSFRRSRIKAPKSLAARTFIAHTLACQRSNTNRKCKRSLS